MFEIYDNKKESYKIKDIYIKDFSKQNFCVFDLEGTGLNHSQDDDIIQFGAVRIENRKIKSDCLDIYVRPQKPIPQNIEKITGISNEKVKNAISFSEAYEKFINFSAECILIAQCGYEYDFGIINSSCERNNIKLIKTTELDTKILFAYLHPELNNTFSTDFLVNFYSVDVSGLMRHTAKDATIININGIKQLRG